MNDVSSQKTAVFASIPRDIDQESESVLVTKGKIIKKKKKKTVNWTTIAALMSWKQN